MKLFRGDTKLKGDQLVINQDTVDYSKNKAGFFFFTDDKKEAQTYATEVMNATIRTNHGCPNITEVSVSKNCKLLDFSHISQDENALEMFDFINKHLFGGKVTLEKFARLQGASYVTKKYEELTRLEQRDYKSRKNDFISYLNGEKLPYNIGQVNLSNGKNGIYFKQLLLDNGYDGYIFNDSFSTGKHYGFISSKWLTIEKKYTIQSVEL